MAGTNMWMKHVAALWKKNKGKMSYRQNLIAAKKTYTKKSSTKKKMISEEVDLDEQGGAIRKAKKRSPKKTPKVEEALEKQMQGGKMKYHDRMHKHLHKNLSGRGGRFDSQFVREKMHQVMSSYHPSLFHSYMTGKARDLPGHTYDEPKPKPVPTRRDPRPSVVDMGGSMSGITHSENGRLQSFDSTFYQHLEIV